jgi:hypothetical protein
MLDLHVFVSGVEADVKSSTRAESDFLLKIRADAWMCAVVGSRDTPMQIDRLRFLMRSK